MANTKISQLTALANPTGNEEFVYAYNGSNGKITLDTMKTYSTSGSQPTLVSGTNIKTINSDSLLGSGDLTVQETLVSGTNIKTINNNSLLGSGNITISGGGASGYDAIVDASGNGDYTTIGAAVNAGKKNIFVRNGSYTEAVQWDVKTAGNNTLHITGESYLGVTVTVDSNITTTGGANRFIDMAVPTGYTEFDFYMNNLNFVLDFSGNVSYFFRTGNNKGKFLVEDCGFTYSGGTGNNYLFYGTNIFEMSTDGNTYNNTKCNMFNRCVFECSTDAANGFVYIMSGGSMAAENCVFKTSGTGTMSLVGSAAGDGYLNHCEVDVYGLYSNDSINILNSRIKMASGGTFYYHSSSTPNDFKCDFIENSQFTINGDLGTAGNIVLGGVCVNCTISITATNLTSFSIGGNLYQNKKYCRGVKVVYDGAVGLSANTMGIYLSTSSLSLNGNGYTHYSGIYMANGGTVTITSSDSVVIGNIWGGATVTDSGTGNVVANNVA